MVLRRGGGGALAGGGGSSLTPPADPGDDGKLAVASGGDLTYLGGTTPGESLVWTGVAWIGVPINGEIEAFARGAALP